MAGTRTAPTVNGTPTFKRVSVSYMDVSGDKRSVSYPIGNADTDAEVEALVAALQAGSQATIYRVSVEDVYNSVEDSGNAEAGSRDSVYDNVAVLAKSSANVSRNFFLPAPDPSIMLGDQDQVDPGSTELGAIFTAYLAVSATFSILSARYTERREINQKINI
jgi:hypothetical protein